MTTAANGAQRLPPGRHGLPAEVVAANQRRRLFDAIAQLHRERGYAAMNVTDITERAGISRATFYQLFDGKPQSVAAAQQDVAESLRAEVLQAWSVALEWPDQVSAAVGAALVFAARAPEQAFLLLSDSFLAEPELARTPIVFHAFLADLLRAGREQIQDPGSVPGLTDHAQVGAFRSVIATRLLAGHEAELPEMKAELVQLMLTPYLGSRDAARIAG